MKFTFINPTKHKIFMIWGGIYPTLFPEYVIKNPLVNGVCIGEGEKTLSEFLRGIETKQPLDKIDGIWYKDYKNEIIS
jgi:radical SAM superfamily enzyme YgiQ (UPF0313 family)